MNVGFKYNEVSRYIPSLIPISVSYVFSVEAAVIVVVIWATWSTLTILRVVDQFDAQSYKPLLFSGFDGHQLSFFLILCFYRVTTNQQAFR